MTQISTVNYATEVTIATYDLLSADAALKKVEACHAAFLQWRQKTHEQHAPYLRNIAGALRKKASEFARLMTQDTQLGPVSSKEQFNNNARCTARGSAEDQLLMHANLG